MVERIARALALDSTVERELVDLARAAYGASARPRIDSGVSMIAGQFGRYLAGAKLVRSFSSAAIPELLRTNEYAAATGLREITPASAAQAVIADDTRSFVFVLTESALRTWPGVADMGEQLGQVAALARRPNVGIGVIQSGSRLPRVPLHGFTIADDDAVHVQTFTAELTLTNSDDVAAYTGCFAVFEQAAVFADAALAVIERATEDFAHLTNG